MVTIKTNQPVVHERATITQNIAKFWDQISEGWRTIWGPHIHHGYYEKDITLTPVAAQEKLIEKLTEMVNINPNNKVLDVGCGMGGSSLYLAKQYAVQVIGVTLSQKQVAIASQQARLDNISHVEFKVEDALSLASIPDHTIDIVWSLESCEQFYDKNLFLQQAFRVLKPGGRILLATWCADQEEYEGQSAKKYRNLCLAFDLPYMPTMTHYQDLLVKNKFIITNMMDWSQQVKPSWEIGIARASAYSFLQLFKLGGIRGLQFIKQAKMMHEAFEQNRVKYGVFIGTKSH